MPTLWTIGYERLLPDELVAELRAAGVERLLDVRYRPQSRRAGMSKTRLGALLGEHDIAYEHRRGLGTPPDIRHDYKSGRLEVAVPAFRAYVENEATEELDELASELASGDAPNTALLCLEADPGSCHRTVVADLLRERVPALVIVEL